MTGIWSDGKMGEEAKVGDKEELEVVITRSRVWEWQCVENETCWVKLARSRSEMNFKALESVRSSTWMLKSPVIRNS